MDIIRHFEYNPSFDLTAAQIGINKWDWETIKSDDEKKAIEIMRLKKYDVLPIEKSDGIVHEYYSTRIWNNYEKLNLNKIDISNSIYYRLSFSDLIRKFHTEQKHYYFLTNYRDTLGLISFVNLNCQIVYNYLYQVIAELEQSIAYLLKEYIEQIEIVDAFRNSDDKHLHEIVLDFEKSVSQGSDNTIFEHMYLQTLGTTLGRFYLKLPEQFRCLNKYTKRFAPNGPYNLIRNRVMHPVRPILNDPDTISNIDNLLTDYQEIKEILRKRHL